MIKAVVFDMDDTLFAESEYVLSGFAAVDQSLSAKGVSGFYEKSKELFKDGHRGSIFNDVLDYLNVPYCKNDIVKLVAIYREHKPAITMLDDAKWAVEELKSMYKLGLITDGYLDAQQNKAKALHLEKDFDVLIFTDQFGREHWKPSEKPYIEVKKLLNKEHHELIYIGDNPTKDFIAARSLGWKTIHIVREGSEYSGVEYSAEYEADYKIKSLYDLPKLIEQIKFTQKVRKD